MKSKIAGSVVMILFAAVVTGGRAADTSPAVDPFAFVAPSIHVSPTERRTIDRGEVLVKILPAQDREIVVFAAGC